MERITEKDSSGRWSIPSEQSEAAAARLAAFENAYERLIARQSENAAKRQAL